jgi:hypothetical protein
MPDLDQGGTARQSMTQYLGPSVGWVSAPLQNVLPISSAGTFALDPNTSLVEVNVAGAVTVILPSTLPSPAGAMAVPGSYLATPISVVDVGGFAAAHPITIAPKAGDTIMGLSSISLSVNFGIVTLQPIPAQRTWSSIE